MSDSPTPIVELTKVSKWYESDPGRRVLDGVDLTISEGERFSIVGSSGCGKSTLLNLIGTLDRPSDGSVTFGNLDSGTATEKELADLRAREIGFIFQLHHLLPQLTALENVLVPTLALHGGGATADDRARAAELLNRVGLADKHGSRPDQLSGGERQRVAVVRSLINRPKLLLADEPTGALDHENAGRLVDLLVELNESENLALIMVTHDQALAERMGSIRAIEDGKMKGADA